jgi:Tol biopolymer transport system component
MGSFIPMTHPFFRRLKNEGEKLVRMKRIWLLLVGLGLLFLIQAGGIAWSQVTERVSVDSAGVEGNNASTAPSTSSDGRYVAFESFATNLVGVGNDNNNRPDVFVHDRQTGTTTRVSVDSGGAEGDDISTDPSISSDGRYVAFESSATNLVAAGGDMLEDIYVHDRQTGITTRVSENTMGNESDGFSLDPSISANGQYVAFLSDATDLVAGDTNGQVDIFVHDRQTGVTTRVSVTSAGNEANGASSFPSISSDGRFVAFESIATDLVVGDTNGFFDIFVHDLQTGATTRVSVDSAGAEGNGGSSSCSISGDGRYVAFVSDASNLVGVGNDTNGSTDVFVHDRDTDGDGIYDELGEVSTVRVSVDSAGAEGDDISTAPSISSDGRYVAFESNATNLVADDTNGKTDVFVHDVQTGETTRVSVDLDGVQGNDDSNNPSMSADGTSVTFQSAADNLVAGDTNTAPDIFVDDLAGAGGGGGSNSGGGGCFISTAAY